MTKYFKATDDEIKEYIMNNFYYDNIKDKICWLKNEKEVKFGIDKHGYIKKGITVKPYTMRVICYHQIIFYLYTGQFNSKLRINHIDGNTSNNNILNLELIKHQQNIAYKTKLSKNNISGYNGIRFNKLNNNWRAIIVINQKSIHIGCYKTLEEAVTGRNKYIIDNNLTYYTTSDKVKKRSKI